jgi:hypothetical protein
MTAILPADVHHPEMPAMCASQKRPKLSGNASEAGSNLLYLRQDCIPVAGLRPAPEGPFGVRPLR